MEDFSILVLDDEPGITLLCERLLKRAGYEVAAFTKIEQAYEHLGSSAVDLLLVDIRMPDANGFEVIAKAKQLQPDIAVLVMTGFGTVETAIQALRQGVDGLLLKPFERGEELVTSVRQALADSQRKRDAARIQALRPLFRVTESLLSETHPERLLELITTAMCGHLRCSNFAYYQLTHEKVDLLSGSGEFFNPDRSKDDAEILKSAHSSGSALLINTSGPGHLEFQASLRDRGLSAIMFVPIMRQKTPSLFYAGRNLQELPFHEADKEMFQILANQAAIAMENARLYDELRDYVKQVEESQQALLQAEKMAAAGRLTASIAHEVNNPLQAVQNCLHLAGRKDLPKAERDEYFELAKTELERLMTTVQRMLDFYRPGTAAAKEVDVADLLKHVLDLMSKQLQERGIEVKVELPPKSPKINAVSSQVQQVFINLILNAFDAMPNGGSLNVRVAALKKGLEILVRDTGVGIPEEGQAHIFEPFFSTKDGGTGLGLTVSYNIVTAHGGTLEYVSDDNPGTCFRVYLPFGGGR